MNKTNTFNLKPVLWLATSVSLFFGIFGVSCSSVPRSDNFVSTKDITGVADLQEKNTQRAIELFERLYSEYSVDAANTPENPEDDITLGTQIGYFGAPGTEEGNSLLVRFGRVWVYDAGIGLSLAVAREDPTADKRALWLMKTGQYLLQEVR